MILQVCFCFDGTHNDLRRVFSKRLQYQNQCLIYNLTFLENKDLEKFSLMQVFPHLEHTYIALACNRGNHKFYSLDSCYFAQLPPNRFVDHRIRRHLTMMTMITRTLGQYVAVQSSQCNLPVHRGSCNENFPNRKKPGRPARIQ